MRILGFLFYLPQVAILLYNDLWDKVNDNQTAYLNGQMYWDIETIDGKHKELLNGN